jgi:integrase/recombinase XerD
MPAAFALSAPSIDLLEQYLTAMRGLNRKTGWSTIQTARSFCAKLDRSGGWTSLSLRQQIDAVGKARSFVSWVLVTGQLTISADLMTHVDLRLGVIARGYLPSTHAWFVAAGAQLRATNEDTALQWNALMKAAAVTGTSPDRVTDRSSTMPGR